MALMLECLGWDVMALMLECLGWDVMAEIFGL
jgi:hypothetical protein